jgi:nucleotide-binding universal stress UspA family protein
MGFLPGEGLFLVIAQRILVPLDFSAEANQALAYAIAVAQPLQAHLILCHVIPTLPLSTARLLAAIVEVEEEARPALATCLQRVHAAGVEGTALLLSGVPGQQILATAAAQQVQLIIVATHKRSPLQHVLSDSVTTQIVRGAPCAVLVLPPCRGLTKMCPSTHHPSSTLGLGTLFRAAFIPLVPEASCGGSGVCSQTSAPAHTSLARSMS